MVELIIGGFLANQPSTLVRIASSRVLSLSRVSSISPAVSPSSSECT